MLQILIQNFSKGNLKILVTKNTLDETFHYVAENKERQMVRAIDKIKKNFDSGVRREYQETLL